MSTHTLETTPAVPLELTFDDDRMTDSAIIGAVADARTARVAHNGRRGSLQAHDARAWTMSGNVD